MYLPPSLQNISMTIFFDKNSCLFKTKRVTYEIITHLLAMYLPPSLQNISMTIFFFKCEINHRKNSFPNEFSLFFKVVGSMQLIQQDFFLSSLSYRLFNKEKDVFPSFNNLAHQ